MVRDLGDSVIISTVLAPFWHVSTTVVHVYNVVSILHTMVYMLLLVGEYVILYTYTLRHVLVKYISNVGSVYSKP